MKIKEKTGLLSKVLFPLFLSGCLTAFPQQETPQKNETSRTMVEKVQQEIEIGMRAADVTRILGSPHFVSTDKAQREVWIYDKVAIIWFDGDGRIDDFAYHVPAR